MMVSFEKNIFLKIVPLFIKNFVLMIFDKISLQASTSCLSNIGIIKLDSKIEDKIESISALTSTDSFQFTVCTLKNDLCIGISSNFVNNDIIKNFCRFFAGNIKINVSGVE